MLDPVAYRKRLLWTGVALLPLISLVTLFHAHDALADGESIVPVLLAFVFVIALVGGTFLLAAKKGPEVARARVAKFARWALPLVLGLWVASFLLLAFVR